MKDRKEQQRPSVSVLVATRNEEKYIGKLLDSLVAQSFPKDRFEVIIIDGMSTDSTLKIVKTYKNRLGLRVFSNPQIYSTYAFNRGIDLANSDLFCIVGAHSYLSENFVEESLNTFHRVRAEEPMLAGVGGICLNESGTTIRKITDLIYSSFFSGARSCRYKKVPHFSDSVIFGVFDKEIVIANGKFDEDILGAGNDDELTIRLHKRGFKFYTDPKIVSHYYPRDSFLEFLRQTYNYGVAKGLMARKGYAPELLNPASLWFVPFSFLFYEILLLVLFVFSGFSSALVFAPMILYLAVNLWVSLDLLIKTKTPLCLVLPAMYFIFHNVLGLSSFMGLVLKGKAFWPRFSSKRVPKVSARAWQAPCS